jgi:ATP-dependent DNA helicase PIF1
LCDSLNTEQRFVYNEIMATVYSKQGGLFFVDGPGETGKTFLYRALLAKLRSQDKLAVATTTSGVAVAIMPGGRTAHSRFKIPLTLQEGDCCSFTKQSGTAKLLQQAALIIWDKASMTKRQRGSTRQQPTGYNGPVSPTLWWEDCCPWWGFQTSPPYCA